MKFKVGDRVRINKNEVLRIIDNLPMWYSEEQYIITKINSDSDVVSLDKTLFGYENDIHIDYLILVSEDRKIKLQKINKNEI